MYYRQSIVDYRAAKDNHARYPRNVDLTAVFDHKLTGLVALLWTFIIGVGFSIGYYAFYEKKLTI
jgi:hypothetical protein